MGIDQVARATGVVQEDGGEGRELTINVSEPELPVSVVPMNRLPVVLLYVPLVEAVTVIAIVQVLLPATVMLENEMDCGGPLTVNEDGEGDAPQAV